MRLALRQTCGRPVSNHLPCAGNSPSKGLASSKVVLPIIVVVVVFFILRAMVRGSGGGILALESKGVRARGLVLSCSPISLGGTTLGGRRFERRTMTLDIEVPGAEPYVSTGNFLIPRGVVETVPGASLDLALDPRDKNKLAVLGPGGFSGPWIRVGPPAAF